MKLNQAVKTGLIAGIATIILKAIEIITPGGTVVALLQYAALIVFLAGSYVAVKRTRDIEKDGEIDFKQGLKAGMTAGLFSSVIVSIFEFFHWTHMNIRENIAEMQHAGVTKDLIKQQLANMNNSSFMNGALMLFALDIVLSFFISIMASMLLRKRTPQLGA